MRNMHTYIPFTILYNAHSPFITHPVKNKINDDSDNALQALFDIQYAYVCNLIGI